MAQLTVYANEPATRGKVILHTTIGPLDVELWSKEAPLACRNFVQLGLEGYYDDCTFHRVIKGFMAQTGDPTSTGNGGESIYGKQFKDECHGRLRFTHRGLLGMASSGPDTNGSQFFITLDRCEWLDKRHTIFGKVTGNSLYNLPRFDELEVDADDKPLYPPKVIRVEVLLEPFDDIVPRQKVAAEPADGGPKKKRKKEKKNLSLLSFGEEAAADEGAPSELPGRVISSHDALRDDARLSRELAVPAAELAGSKERRRAAASSSDALRARAAGSGGGGGGGGGGGAADAPAVDGFEERMRAQMQQRQARLEASKKAAAPKEEAPAESAPADPRSEYEALRSELRGAAKGGWKWRGAGTKDSDDDDDDDDDEGDGLSELERRRAKFVQQKRASAGLSKKQRQEATLHRLQGFKASLGEGGKGADDWKAHVLKFETKKLEAESASMYESHDPLLHGADGARASAKIREREKAMLSMKKGWDVGDDEL